MDAEPNLTPRQRALLVFIGDAGPNDLDPVRIMKGMFLIARETPPDWLPSEARYQFMPYNYGPYSSAIYADLDELERLGYVRPERALGQHWKHYWLTPRGREMAVASAATLGRDVVRYINSVRGFVTRLSFRDLLTAVYRRYPDYAVNSVFQQR